MALTPVVIDPSAVADSGRVELDLNGGPIRVGEDGIDWGDAAIEQYLAEQERGQLPVDFRIPNRQITIPLLLGADSAATYATAKANLQAKVALIQREGGWLKRGTALYCDLTGATLKLPDRYGNLGINEAQLTLEAIPDFYGDEIDLGDNTETTNPEIVVTKTSIQGDYPGRLRMVVDNDQSGTTQKGLIGGIRCKNYDSASSAALVYDCNSMTLLDESTSTADSSAGGSTCVQHANISSGNWTPILSTTLSTGPTKLTHRGSYKVWVRAHNSANASTSTQLRLVYDLGDMVNPVENDPAYFPTTSGYTLVCLGEVRLDKPPVGTHGWIGYIQGKGASGNAATTIRLDRIWFFPTDEAYFEITAPAATTTGLASYLSKDTFTSTTAGSDLATRTPELGTAWATSGEASADFKFADAGDPNLFGIPSSECVYRTSQSGVSRYGVLGSNQTNMVVSATFGVADSGNGVSFGGLGKCGVIARWVDSNNYLRATIRRADASDVRTFELSKIVAGSETVLASTTMQPMGFSNLTVLVLAVTSTGEITAIANDGGAYTYTLTASDSVAATSGTLQTGKGGIIDTGGGIIYAPKRYYDNVTIQAIATPNAVCYSTKSIQVRTDAVYREVSAGGSYGKLVPNGDLPRIPVSGLEARTVQFMIKMSRGDLSSTTDPGTDDLSVRCYYRPSWLFPPEA